MLAPNVLSSLIVQLDWELSSPRTVLLVKANSTLWEKLAGKHSGDPITNHSYCYSSKFYSFTTKKWDLTNFHLKKNNLCPSSN